MNGRLTTWWLNGVKADTFTEYHENGRKAYEALFEDGKMVSHQTWSANGENTSTPVEVPQKVKDQ